MSTRGFNPRSSSNQHNSDDDVSPVGAMRSSGFGLTQGSTLRGGSKTGRMGDPVMAEQMVDLQHQSELYTKRIEIEKRRVDDLDKKLKVRPSSILLLLLSSFYCLLYQPFTCFISLPPCPVSSSSLSFIFVFLSDFQDEVGGVAKVSSRS